MDIVNPVSEGPFKKPKWTADGLRWYISVYLGSLILGHLESSLKRFFIIIIRFAQTQKQWPKTKIHLHFWGEFWEIFHNLSVFSQKFSKNSGVKPDALIYSFVFIFLFLFFLEICARLLFYNENKIYTFLEMFKKIKISSIKWWWWWWWCR